MLHGEAKNRKQKKKKNHLKKKKKKGKKPKASCVVTCPLSSAQSILVLPAIVPDHLPT